MPPRRVDALQIGNPGSATVHKNSEFTLLLLLGNWYDF